MKKLIWVLIILLILTVPACAEIILPSNLTVIGTNAFANNTDLVGELVIPDGVTAIGDSAFKNCTGITEVTIPEGVTTIGEAAFKDCTSLTAITIPDSVTVIEEKAFSGCTNLETVITSDGREIAENAFEGSMNVTIIPPKPDSSPAEDFDYTVSGDEVTITGYKGSDAVVVIPEVFDGKEVTVIGEYAFCDSENLYSIYLPANVHSINESAFYGCSRLRNVYGTENVTVYGDNAFGNCTDLSNILISGRVRQIGDCAFLNTCVAFHLNLSVDCIIGNIPVEQSYASILLYRKTDSDASVAKALIGDYCKEIQVLDVFDGLPVVSIESEAFYAQNLLETVYLPVSIQTIGRRAFSYCDNLKHVYGAENVLEFNERVFEGCYLLSTISLNPDLLQVGTNCFRGCAELKDTYLFGTDNNISQYAFQGSGIVAYIFSVENDEATLVKVLSSIQVDFVVPDHYRNYPVTRINIDRLQSTWKPQTIVLPDTLLRIENEALFYNDDLVSVSIPDTCIYIGDYAFDSCANLSDIVLPESLQYLGESALCGTALKNINIPIGITALPPYCFYRTNLESFTFPQHVTAVGKAAFGETKLKTVVIPEWVTSLGDYIFSSSKELTEVTILSDLKELPSCAFSDCVSLTTVNLPDSIVSFGTFAFSGCTNLEYVELPESLNYVPNCAFRDTGMRAKAVERVINECVTRGMTDFEKALAFHDWLISNADYSSKVTFFGAEGVLVYGEGVCQSYTDAYAMLLSEVGIAHNNVTSLEMDHSWNLVYLDGEWYHVDCTWDDPIGGKENHDYFGLNDQKMKEDHSWELPDYYPAANGTRYRYGVDNGATAPKPTPVPTPKPTPAPKPTPKPAPALPETPLSDFEYEINGTEATITRYLGEDATVVIPDSMQGATVTTIGDYAFNSKMKLEVVSMPESVHTLACGAFYGCDRLEAVYGTENVVRYNSNAFENCTNLSYIYVSEDIVELDYGVFLGCQQLPKTVLCVPDDVAYKNTYNYGESIYLYFFKEKDGEATITGGSNGGINTFWHVNIPEFYRDLPVTSVAPGAFSGDYYVSGLTMHNGIKVIGENAFSQCRNLVATVYCGGRIVWNGAFSGSTGVTLTQKTDPMV